MGSLLEQIKALGYPSTTVELRPGLKVKVRGPSIAEQDQYAQREDELAGAGMQRAIFDLCIDPATGDQVFPDVNSVAELPFDMGVQLKVAIDTLALAGDAGLTEAVEAAGKGSSETPNSGSNSG